MPNRLEITATEMSLIIDDLFEDTEYTEPTSAFITVGHKLTHVGLKEGKTVKGKNKGIEVPIDVAIKDASVDDFDALFIPGGYSPDKLKVSIDRMDGIHAVWDNILTDTWAGSWIRSTH